MGFSDSKRVVGLVAALVVLAGAYGLMLASGTHSVGVAATPQAAASTGGAASCAPGAAGAQSVKTQEFGKAGAKVEVVALLPITHGCHVNTEATLKKIQAAHPKDIHLTIVDLFGPDAAKYQKRVGGGQRTGVDQREDPVHAERPQGGSGAAGRDELQTR